MPHNPNNARCPDNDPENFMGPHQLPCTCKPTVDDVTHKKPYEVQSLERFVATVELATELPKVT